jgi:hypothetical protein
MEFRLQHPGGVVTIRIGFTAAQERNFRQGRKGERFTATALVIDDDGITVDCELGVLRYVPEGWDGFWQRKARAEGLDACKAWDRWLVYRLENNAAFVLDELAEGRLTWFDARERYPDVFEHPRIQSALAQAFVTETMPPRRPGKRAKISEAQWQLYEWASFYYITGTAEGRGVTSWEMACDLACFHHPDLVPDTWKQSPGESLRKTVAPVCDHHPTRRQRWSRTRRKRESDG